MNLYRLKDIAEMYDKCSTNSARKFISAEIRKGNWSRTKIQGIVYYSVVHDIDWHDIFNLRSRKPHGQAWAEYRSIIDERIYG